MKVCEQCHLRYPNESSFCFVDGKTLVPLKDPRVGTTLLGRYVIEDVIGEGGMATVYRARLKHVDRPCAIKIMSPGLSKDKVVRERFRREAKAAQKLAHPNIIEISDQGDTEDGSSFLVMELLEGACLADLIAEEPLPVARALPIMIQIARALARAHDFGVIHRDLKPENVFVCPRKDGTELVKLLDFGIARSMQDSRLTGVGEVFGTPQYMAPERITSIDAGAPSDLYAVGVIYFEILAGKLPFEANDIPTWFIKHMKEVPPPLRSVVPDAPEPLERLIASLLAKDAKDRPVDAHSVHGELVEISRRLRVPVPVEPEAEAASIRPPASSLAPAGLDRWARRTMLFDQMLQRAFASSPPGELLRMLGEIKRLVGAIGTARAEGSKQQRALESIESRGREGRQRFGFAVDALGVDASRAREEARTARAAVEPLTAAALAARDAFVASHGDVLQWEGRSGFQEPWAQLSAAYRASADRMDAWVAARTAEKRALEVAEGKAREVTDLEYQIHELRAALQRMEQGVEAERTEIERRIHELDQESDRVEAELLALAGQFCAPLRKRAELGPLFQELEADAAVA
jgi:serine/threonine-protein kinase